MGNAKSLAVVGSVALATLAISLGAYAYDHCDGHSDHDNWHTDHLDRSHTNESYNEHNNDCP